MDRKLLLGAATAAILTVPTSMAAEGLRPSLAEGMAIGGGVVLEIDGFVRVDYMFGDPIAGASGEDAFGVSKAALSATAKHDESHTSATIVFGGGDMTGFGTPGDLGGEVFLVDVFITAENLFGKKAMISGGLRPILFGLKPAGFPGDHSLAPSLEYGAQGNFASSNQAGASIVSWIWLKEWLRVELGTFDSDAGSLATDEGSQIFDNNFVQLRATDIAGSGVYAVAGVERRYVSASDSSEPIVDIGAGIQHGMFDLSFEAVFLDAAIAGTAADETYLIAELLVKPCEGVQLYFDYANAAEADVDTYRLGGVYQINSFLSAHAEWAHDSLSTDDTDSGNLRIAAGF